MTLTGPPAVCLQSKQVCGWCSQHGTALHPAASGLTRDFCEDKFVDFSSAFNTIIPDTLQNKLTQLSVPTSVCQWITSTRTISTGAPQGCVLSPLLFSLYTNDCPSKDPSVKLLKFADDTTLIGLIQDSDESAYRQKVKELAVWYSLNNLELNTLKAVEMIFRRNPPPPTPPTHHHEQLCDCSGVIQIPGITPPTLQELCSSRERAKSLWTPHIQHTPSLKLLPSGWRYRALSTRMQNQFLSPRNPSHEHLTLNVEHTTLLSQLFIHHTFIFHFKICTYQTSTHNFLYYILCFCFFCTLPICIFVHYYFIIYVLSCCCHSVTLWSFCHYNKFLVCVNIPGL